MFSQLCDFLAHLITWGTLFGIRDINLLASFLLEELTFQITDDFFLFEGFCLFTHEQVLLFMENRLKFVDNFFVVGNFFDRILMTFFQMLNFEGVLLHLDGDGLDWGDGFWADLVDVSEISSVLLVGGVIDWLWRGHIVVNDRLLFFSKLNALIKLQVFLVGGPLVTDLYVLHWRHSFLMNQVRIDCH